MTADDRGRAVVGLTPVVAAGATGRPCPAAPSG